MGNKLIRMVSENLKASSQEDIDVEAQRPMVDIRVVTRVIARL
jgi:uncharacterized protein YaaN involved in tellurite resistance